MSVSVSVLCQCQERHVMPVTSSRTRQTVSSLRLQHSSSVFCGVNPVTLVPTVSNISSGTSVHISPRPLPTTTTGRQPALHSSQHAYNPGGGTGGSRVPRRLTADTTVPCKPQIRSPRGQPDNPHGPDDVKCTADMLQWEMFPNSDHVFSDY